MGNETILRGDPSMGRRQWSQVLDQIRAELDLGPRLEEEGRTADDRLDRIERALVLQTEALGEIADQARAAKTSADHALELFQELVARDDSDSSMAF
jgi:hypothetical protein